MDYTVKENDIIVEIQSYMNNNSKQLLDRLNGIIEKFEVKKTLKTEEDFKMEFTPLIKDIANSIGVEFNSNYEKYVKSGRIDCFYRCIDLEYKAPGAIEVLNSYPTRESSNKKYIDQVHRQIEGYSSREKIDKDKILGIIFDGKYIIYTYYLATDWYISNPHQVNRSSLETFFIKLFSSEIRGRAVSVSNLIEDFGYNSDISRSIVNYFYYKLIESKNEKVEILFLQWKSLFREVSGYNSDTVKLDINEIVQAYQIEKNELQIDYLIFSIHTYYAMLIKFLVTELLKQKRIKLQINHQINYDNSLNAYQEVKDMESGNIFRALGINNFIEDDFFSWYLEEWDESSYILISDFLKKVNLYNFSDTLRLDDNGSQDLLRKLYNYLMPKTLRHSLGEYYSPDWLAQLTYNNIGIDGNMDCSVLDPTCGSGTFINIAIREIIEKNSECDKITLLKNILSNIHGFDLNPLAVITARANYLLALGDLIDCTNESIEIPIYHCDAMLTVLEQNINNHKVKKISTRAGIFEIPIELCKNKETLYRSLNIIESNVNSEEQFVLEIFYRELGIIGDDELDNLVNKFYNQIVELDKKGILHVWIQIIKNAFIPLFHNKVDVIIGNPPWVNWQTLPEDYRESIHQHWYEYKIFDFTGIKARLGNAHDDISVLLTYVVMDNFLKQDGKLAFIINQNLLQAYGGGDGFRKFKIKEHIPVKVMKVDDFVDVEPFLSSGASNKTAVIYLEKGKQTVYPVEYYKWKKDIRGQIDSEDTLESVMNKISYRVLEAKPVNSDIYNSSWMVGTHIELGLFDKMVGHSNYVARKGVDTSANGIFWLEIMSEIRGMYYVRNTPENSKKKIPQFEGPIEKTFLYPLVRGKDLKKWHYRTPYQVIIPYESNMKNVISKDNLRKLSPNLFKYFYDSDFNKCSNEFLNILTTRGTYVKHYSNQTIPEYVLYNIGEYTSSPYKVIWKALASKGMEACVIGKENKLIIPDHNNVLIPFDNEDEAYFICAIINSKIIGRFIDSYISWFKSNHILENINIPTYDDKNIQHLELVKLSKNAHINFDKKDVISDIEMQIDNLVISIILGE